MGRRKKTAEVQSKEIYNKNLDGTENVDIINPGDCCGNYLATDESCMICEIASTCKDMTESFNEEK